MVSKKQKGKQSSKEACSKEKACSKEETIKQETCEEDCIQGERQEEEMKYPIKDFAY